MNEPIVTIVGNLVADPEPRISAAGKSWVTFRVASTPRVRDRQTGGWSDGEALFVSCRAFGEFADNIAATLTKGMRVIVSGKLTQRSYTDNHGAQRTSMEVEVEAVGPELMFATATVTRSQRAQGGAGAPNNAGSGGWAQPGANGAQNGAQKMSDYYGGDEFDRPF